MERLLLSMAFLFGTSCISASSHQGEGIKAHLNHRRVEEWAYPLFAFRNPREGKIRVYGQFAPTVIGNNSDRGEKTQMAGCFVKGDGKEELVPLVSPISELMRYEDDLTDNLMHITNYILECHDPGTWATELSVRLHNGKDAGRALAIINMETERKGALGVCSQPLHTNRAWLKDWVLHQFMIGAHEVFLHVPKGQHIDDLFSEHRDERLEFNADLAERTAFQTGTEPLQRFQHHDTVWREYWPSPTARYYAEEIVFSACHYSLRYAYDYTIQFDVDEFWTAGEHTTEKLLPDFLDKNMHPDAVSIGFFQVQYPLDCPTRATGTYANRFTLRKEHEKGQVKPAVRPLNVRRMHVHWVLVPSQDWMESHPDGNMHYWEVPIEQAFLKHIRPSTYIAEDGSVHHYPCMFGVEVDPDHELLVASY